MAPRESTMACASEELSWFRQLGRMAGNVANRMRPHDINNNTFVSGSKCWAVNTTKSQWRSFDLADVMEEGLAQEMITSFVSPPPQEEPSKSLLVVPSEDESEYVLMSEEGEAVLLARAQKGGSRLDIYVPAGGDPPVAVGPAFTLTQESNQYEWTLTSERCECCEYLPSMQKCCSTVCKRELMHVRHTREEIGRGVVMCMEVDLPALRMDGTPEIWCARLGNNKALDKICLESRKPKWSPRLKGITLDFYGRVKLASAKNCQLQLKGAQKRDKEAEFLFGKIDADTYVLDYKHPLGMAQAFAIALTTRGFH